MSSRVGSHACCRRGRRHWLSCFAERESGKLAGGGLGQRGVVIPPPSPIGRRMGPPANARGHAKAQWTLLLPSHFAGEVFPFPIPKVNKSAAVFAPLFVDWRKDLRLQLAHRLAQHLVAIFKTGGGSSCPCHFLLWNDLSTGDNSSVSSVVVSRPSSSTSFDLQDASSCATGSAGAPSPARGPTTGAAQPDGLLPLGVRGDSDTRLGFDRLWDALWAHRQLCLSPRQGELRRPTGCRRCVQRRPN